MTNVNKLNVRVYHDGMWKVEIEGLIVSAGKNKLEVISASPVQQAIRNYYSLPDDVTGILAPFEDYDYLVSTDGFIYSLKTKKKLSEIYRFGCPTVRTHNYGFPKGVWLAKTVLRTFAECRNKNAKVIHKDGNKQNCKFENLEWSMKQIKPQPYM